MRILAFAATTSRSSINKALASHAARTIESGLIPGAQVELIDLNDYELPLYSIDRERELGIPDVAQRFFDKIGEADALIISFAEHNGSYTAAYKNLYDWASRIDSQVFQDTPSVMFSASMGPGGARSVLATALGSAPFYGTEVKASMSVPSFGENFDAEEGRLSNHDLQAQLEEALRTLREVRSKTLETSAAVA